MKSAPHYSGDKSDKFWKRIHRMTRAGERLYHDAVELHNLEAEVLSDLHEAELAAKKRKAKA